MVLGSPQQRSVPLGEDHAAARARFVEAIVPCLDTCEERGVRLCLEPLGPGETNFLNTLSEARTLIRATSDHPACRTIFDVKAAATENAPFATLIRDNAERVLGQTVTLVRLLGHARRWDRCRHRPAQSPRRMGPPGPLARARLRPVRGEPAGAGRPFRRDRAARRGNAGTGRIAQCALRGRGPPGGGARYGRHREHLAGVERPALKRRPGILLVAFCQRSSIQGDPDSA